ncbi:hypothetical protein B0H67DRAFT_558161 [Lasiosphaeris hirsuta]|uniref:Tetraspanin n=1 Tax=Lasiosphaeris hirsuta TaxID=260670 RepID=A0AA39ZXQ5_9PEZI|nr:hypothetical protein B0H67DRAFT_558161 [Lasiosphaeris hirsuta]
MTPKSWVTPSVYILVLLALTGVAIYAHIKTTSLSLPTSPLLTLLPALLPAISLLTTLPRLTNALLPWALQTLQLLLTTILATLLLSPTPPCTLETKWRAFWTSHDATKIRAIQDALDCCGFRSVKDMAWPFPSKEGGVACAARFGRTEACAGPWEAAMRGEKGTLAGVVLVVGVVQIVYIVAARMGRREGVWGLLGGCGRGLSRAGGRRGQRGLGRCLGAWWMSRRRRRGGTIGAGLLVGRRRPGERYGTMGAVRLGMEGRGIVSSLFGSRSMIRGRMRGRSDCLGVNGGGVVWW